MDKETSSNKKLDYIREMQKIGLTPQMFSMFGGASDDISSYGSMTDDFDITTIKSWLLDPEKNSENLINASRYFYVAKSYVFKVINRYVNLLRLDYNIIPEFQSVNFPAKEDLYDNLLDTRNYLNQVLDKTTVRNMIKSVLKKGAYYGYERSQGDIFHIQTLPDDFCRRGNLVNSLFSIEFNFAYFDNKDESELDGFDKEFKSLYIKYQNNKELQWQQLNPKKTVLILSEDDDFSFPLITGLLTDLLDLDDFYGYLKKGVKRDSSQIFIQKGQLDKDTGEPLTDPNVLRFYHQALESGLRGMNQDATVVSTLFDVDSIDFTKSKSSDAGYTSIDNMNEKVTKGSGVPEAVMGTSDSATALRLNLADSIGFVMSIIEKVEKWINVRLKERKHKDVVFKVRYIPTTYNDEANHKLLKGLLDNGGSLMATISSAGMNPYEYMDLVAYESIMGYKDLLELPLNINTSSSKGEGGRPKVSDDQISDSGEQTRDSDGNDR